MVAREFGKPWLLCVAVMCCCGCSRAPSAEVIGTFLPAWMFCIAGGLVFTGLVRLALVRYGLEKKLGPLVVFYPSVAVAIGCLLWLIFFA
jgi:YtcA family